MGLTSICIWSSSESIALVTKIEYFPLSLKSTSLMTRLTICSSVLSSEYLMPSTAIGSLFFLHWIPVGGGSETMRAFNVILFPNVYGCDGAGSSNFTIGLSATIHQKGKKTIYVRTHVWKDKHINLNAYESYKCLLKSTKIIITMDSFWKTHLPLMTFNVTFSLVLFPRTLQTSTLYVSSSSSVTLLIHKTVLSPSYELKLLSYFDWLSSKTVEPLNQFIWSCLGKLRIVAWSSKLSLYVTFVTYLR